MTNSTRTHLILLGDISLCLVVSFEATMLSNHPGIRDMNFYSAIYKGEKAFSELYCFMFITSIIGIKKFMHPFCIHLMSVYNI